MRYPEVPEPNTVIEVSALDDSFNLVDVFFVAGGLTGDSRGGLICGYLVRSDYVHNDNHFGKPYTMNLLTHEWQYINSPATTAIGVVAEQSSSSDLRQLIERLIAHLDNGRANGTIYTYGQVQERLRAMLDVLGPQAVAQAALGDEGLLVEPELAELDRQRRALEVAIGYDLVPLSIRDHPEITREFRTTADRDGLVTRILDAGFRVEESR